MYIVQEDDIKKGRVTDIYFKRALEVIEAKGLDKKVKAEISVKGLPKDYSWAVLCGLEEVFELLESKDVDVRSIPEGSVFFENEPVVEIEGMYSEFAVLETAILGILSQESGVSTKAARIKKIAGNKSVLSFGARRMHPAVSVAIERAAYIGGCDGFSTVLAGDVLNITPSGTMPHSLMLLTKDTLNAAKYFDEIVESDVPRVVLIDTFGDEKFETLRIAEALGNRLDGIRLDTPSSRRGNMKNILKELRWELNLRGFEDVQLFVSGGLDEESVFDIVDEADGFGVGTSLSSAKTIDFSLDIVEIEGKPVSKKGKISGSKSLFVCRNCFNRKIVPFGSCDIKCSCGASMEDALVTAVEKGSVVYKKEDIETIRIRCLKEVRYVD